MIPILYPSDNLNYQRLGKGKLGDILSCVIHEEINGDYSCTFEYPVTGLKYKDLLDGGTIMCLAPYYATSPSFKRSGQFFDIYKHSIPIDGVVTFYARHVSRRLASHVFIPGVGTYPTGSFNGLSLVEKAGGDTWTTPTIENPVSLLAYYIGEENSCASVSGGEFAFWTETQTTPVSNKINYIYKNRLGSDKGVQIRYGSNLQNIESTKDLTETYNALVPFWDDGDGNKTYASGYVVQPTTPITPIIAVPFDATDYFETQPSSSDLVTLAQSILDATTPWIGDETLTVDFINGDEIDLHGADVSLGDTVHVYWNDADIATDLRVMAYDYDCLTESYLKMYLGKQQTNYVAVTGIDASGGGGGGIPAPSIELYDSTPEPLGTASPGTSDKAARGDHVHALPSASDVGAAAKTWTRIGSSSDSGTTKTYPATATELLIKGKSSHSYNPAYFTVVPVAAIQDVSIIQVGGYYYSSSDYGLANVNHDAANRTLAFRNLRYGSNTSGTFTFYYR